MLHVHRSERADALIEPLAAVLAVAPADPFTPDVVAVPTQGVERWLAQRLSHRLGTTADDGAGICAHIAFASPSRLTSGVLSRVLDLDAEDDPWSAAHLVWALLEVIDECAGQAWCAALGRHVGALSDDDVRHGRRLGVARHLATLFTSYGVQRPEMLRRWAAGTADDGAGQQVPADLAWQVQLWQRLRERLGVASPAERLSDALHLLRERPEGVALPDRLSVFGPTRLPTDQLAILHALSVHRDVHVWMPHPSPALWAQVTASTAATPAGRRHDYVHPARHPLLASMARDVTELQLRVMALGPVTDVHHRVLPPVPRPTVSPEPHATAEAAPTLLAALQRQLRLDEPGDPDGVDAPGDRVHRLDLRDRSVEVHACHGRSRQVEVLRELLVGLLASDPTLEPRDVLVMCPDIESVAPLVTAAFGVAPDTASGGVPHPGHTLRVQLADRSLQQVNPQLGLLADLLALADGRLTASEVLDLAATDPLRRRFRFDDEDLTRLREWAVAGGVHWGEDAARRARFGLPQLRQGTWDVGLDRILLGAAMAEEDSRYVGAALPMDDVDSTDIDLAGRLSEFIDRLATLLAGLSGVRPLRDWLDTLGSALDLLADAAPADGWQGVQARQVLADVRRAGAGRDELPLRLPDVRALLASRLTGRPTRAGFRTGALTMCSLEPMRAVPHRVVCLLGLDDGVFPRTETADGDDVLLRDPWIGERDRRGEDRQLLLDAVVAASEHLVILYSGADERTGAPRPPAVPVGELLDALDHTATTLDGRAVREHIVVRHPLQPVDDRNFTPGALHRRGPFSYDTVAYRAAVTGRGERVEPQPFLDGPLPVPPGPDTIDLDDLVRMLEHPAKWFLRRRLQIWLPGDSDEVTDRLPLEVDSLQAWQIGDRLLTSYLDGIDPTRAVQAEWRRGEVPPRQLGRAALVSIDASVVPVARAVGQHASGAAAAIDVSVDLPSGTSLVGTVGGVHDDLVVRGSYSRLAAKHRLRAWVQLLALVASDPGRDWTAVTVGRAPGRRPGTRLARLRAPNPAEALQWLGELVGLRDRALQEPLPLPVAAAHTYAAARHGGDSQVQALETAERGWDGGFEKADQHHVFCWGENARFGVLLGTPDATEQAWWPDEGTRFGVLARRVWTPLLDHERTEHA